MKRKSFAMTPERHREIARKGGIAAHKKGTAHEFTTETAREAGRKGGLKVSQDRAHMAALGRKGGHAKYRRLKKQLVSAPTSESPNITPSAESGQ